MYLPSDLATVLHLMVKAKRAERNFWRDVMKDEKRAYGRTHELWTLMSLRDAAAGKPVYIGS